MSNNDRDISKLPENQLTPTTRGVGTGMNFSNGTESPSRLYMLGKNQGKAAVIRCPTGRKIITGDEQQYAKTARKVEIYAKSEVEEIFFVKDPFNRTEPTLWGSMYVIFKNLEEGYFYLLEFPKFHNQNMELGFEFHYDKKMMRRLVKGAIFEKGDVFGSSARISESGEWCPGRETIVAPMSHYSTEEDSVYISDRYAAQVGVTFNRRMTHQWNEDEYVPLNLYGTIDHYQPFPLPGEAVREDGIVMAFRKKDSKNALVALTKKALMEVDPIYDRCFFVHEPGCIVANITADTDRYKNQANNKKAFKRTQPHTQHLEMYEEAQNTFNNEVVSWYLNKESYLKEGEQVPIDEALWNFILMARGNITVDRSTPYNKGKYNTIKRKFQHILMKDWRIIIDLKQDVEAKARHKNTGLQGNKSTIGKIVPWQMMPKDKNGRYADMVVGNFPAFRRQIFGSLIELDVNFVNINIYPEIKELILKQDYKNAWDKAFKFYDTVAPDFAKLMNMLNADERIAHLEHIAKDENEFSVWFKSDSEVVGIEIIDRLQKEYGHIKPERVTYINDFGDEIETIHPIPLSSVYYVMLDKFGDDISSQSTSKLNIFGLPTSLSKNERTRNFFRAHLNRNVGETEGRLYINQKGGAAAVRALALANSPELLEIAVERILTAPNPFTMDYLIYPGEESKNYSLQVIDNILGDYGLVLREEHETDRT